MPEEQAVRVLNVDGYWCVDFPMVSLGGGSKNIVPKCMRPAIKALFFKRSVQTHNKLPNKRTFRVLTRFHGQMDLVNFLGSKGISKIEVSE